MGGRDAPALHAMVFHEELGRSHAQLPYIGAGVALVGPTLIQWGTEAQKQRFIPDILSGDGDLVPGILRAQRRDPILTSLLTTADEDGDYFVVNGSKIWTSQVIGRD